MHCSVYKINKGINKSIEFRGLKAQYIWWLGGGLVGLMVAFAVLYIIGVSPYICVGLVLLAGAGLFIYVYKLSNTYGEHGMMKKMARRSIPKSLTCNSRKIFMKKMDGLASSGGTGCIQQQFKDRAALRIQKFKKQK